MSPHMALAYNNSMNHSCYNLVTRFAKKPATSVLVKLDRGGTAAVLDQATADQITRVGPGARSDKSTTSDLFSMHMRAKTFVRKPGKDSARISSCKGPFVQAEVGSWRGVRAGCLVRQATRSGMQSCFGDNEAAMRRDIPVGGRV